MEAFLTSTALVALAEIGDKTQLLSFALAARLGRPVAISLGILVATIVNHALAATVGVWIASYLQPEWIRWGAGIAFIVFGLWALVPDEAPEGHAPSGASVFLTTVVAFFIAEMGDKTQLATVALGARFAEPVAVTLGTTLGMMIANVPAVFLGRKLAERLDFRRIRWASAALFVATGVLTLVAG
jgi:putative Ca2+/H+ antiporter (TMEM165/GDT1 family)